MTEEEMFAKYSERMSQQHESHMVEIQRFNALEIINYLDEALISTEVVMEGVANAEKITPYDGIMATALGHMRDAVESAMVWVEANRLEADDEESHSSGKSENKNADNTETDEL